jgi:hypothetical protein
MARIFLILSVIAGALVATVWCTLLHPAPPFPYSFQAEIQTSTPTVAQLYYERGAGLTDSESAKAAVAPFRNFTKITLPIPEGKYRALYFTPGAHLDGGIVHFRHARITTFDGRVMRSLSAGDFDLNPDTGSATTDGDGLKITSRRDGSNPRLTVKFDPYLRLGVGFWSKFRLHAPRWLKVFGLSLLSMIIVRAAAIRRALIVEWWQSLRTSRPRLALVVIAVLATSLASYPVIFFGKSLLSPTSGSVLLYDRNPTLPDFSDLREDNVHSSDVGAMMWQHLPYTVHQHRALAAGELPLWNRYNSTGSPLLGQGQSMLGDPMHLPVIAAGGAAWAFDAKFILAKLLFACGVGWCAWALTRDFGASSLAILGGAFVGFFSYRFNHPALFSLGYAPWILVAWFEIARAETRSSVLAGMLLWSSSNLCEVVSGTVKEAYVLCFALNFAGALIFALGSLTAREKLRRLAFLSVTGVGIVLVSAPVWWTFFHTLGSAFTSYDVPTVLQIRREWFIGFFDDLFYREMIPRHAVYMPAANFLVFLGCFFAVTKPTRLWKNPATRVLALFALGAFCVAFQTGSTEGTPQWMLKLPLFRNLYHVNNLFSCVALVLTCVLAGWGFSVARETLVRVKPSRYLLPGAAAFVVMFIPYFTFTPPGWTEHEWHSWGNADLHQRIVYLHVLLLPFALGVLVAAARRRLREVKWTPVTAVPVLVALLFLLGRHGQHLPFFPPNDLLTTPGTRPHLFATSPAVDFLRDATSREPARVFGTGNTLFPGFSSVYDLEGINAPDALVNRQYHELGSALGWLGSGWQIRITNEELDRWRHALDFFNVGYVVTEPAALRPITGLRRIANLDMDIWRNEQVWPRAFFVSRLESYDTVAELAQRILASTPSPFAAIQSADLNADLKPFAANSPGTEPIPAKQYRLETNKTSFTIAAPSPGIAVLQEAWLADDFVARVDGRVVPYFRVNHVFKGVAIPTAGVHRIEFGYWPQGFTQSLAASVLGLVLLVMGIGVIWFFEKEVSPSVAANAQG